MSFSFSKAAKGLVAGGIAAMIAANGFAATQGTTGATSTGDLDISLTILDEIRISGLQDITLGTFAGTDLGGASPVCVYRSGTGNYNLTATGDGAGSAFELDDGGTNTVAYTVTYDDGSGPTGLTSGITLTGQTGGDPASDTCAGTGQNGQVVVNVLATDMAALPAAAYNGTLTLVVAPE